MAQESVAQAHALVRAFDQARQISDNDLAVIAHVDDAAWIGDEAYELSVTRFLERPGGDAGPDGSGVREGVVRRQGAADDLGGHHLSRQPIERAPSSRGRIDRVSTQGLLHLPLSRRAGI